VAAKEDAAAAVADVCARFDVLHGSVCARSDDDARELAMVQEVAAVVAVVFEQM
jgi:hypothetical protein